MRVEIGRREKMIRSVRMRGLLREGEGVEVCIDEVFFFESGFEGFYNIN